MSSDGPQSGCDDCAPYEQPAPGEESPPYADPSVQKTVRVPQRNADEKQVRQKATHLAPQLLLITLKKRLSIRGQISLQQIGRVQPTQEVNDLSLGRRGITPFFHTVTPYLTNGSAAVQHRHEIIGRVVQTKELIASWILQDVPLATAKMLPVHVDGAEQLRRQLGNAIPGLAEGRTVNRHLPASLKAKVSFAAN